VLAASDSPEAGFGAICYIAAPAGGLLVELVSTVLEPVITEWINSPA